MEDFRYASPETISEACELLASYGDEALVLSGGQSLMPLLRNGTIKPDCIIDLNGIKDQSYVRRNNDGLEIGCLARHAHVATSDAVASTCPVLGETAAEIGDMQVRNMGTFCGAVAHADPSGDPPVLATLLDAEIEAMSTSGTTTYEGASFYHGFYETELDKDEVVTEVRFPATPSSCGADYEKWEPSEGSFPVATVGTFVELDEGIVADTKIVTGALEGGPTRMADAEDILNDETPSQDLIMEAAKVSGDSAQPIEDSEGSVKFKRHLAKVLTKNSLTGAVAAAGGAV